MVEEWRTILEFTNYDVSNRGNIWNRKRNKQMSTSLSNHGHVKITLTAYDGTRHTRSVAQLVAEAFLDPPNLLCDAVIVLDGDLTHVDAENLAWRPQWFAWKYTRQLKTPQPRHYLNLPVINTDEQIIYDSIEEAGRSEGILFDDVWRSTYQGIEVFPHGCRYEIV